MEITLSVDYTVPRRGNGLSRLTAILMDYPILQEDRRSGKLNSIDGRSLQDFDHSELML
jgi:hypothetical protein